MKTITLVEFGSEMEFKIIITSIKKFYSFTYNSGETVTIVEFLDGTETHFKNSLNYVESLINN